MTTILTITHAYGLTHRSVHPVGDYCRLIESYDPFVRISTDPNIGRPRSARTVVSLIDLWNRMHPRTAYAITEAMHRYRS